MDAWETAVLIVRLRLAFPSVLAFQYGRLTLRLWQDYAVVFWQMVPVLLLVLALGNFPFLNESQQAGIGLVMDRLGLSLINDSKVASV